MIRRLVVCPLVLARIAVIVGKSLPDIAAVSQDPRDVATRREWPGIASCPSNRRCGSKLVRACIRSTRATDGLEGFVELEAADGGGIDLTRRDRAHLSLPVARLSSGNALEDRELQRRIDARRFPTIDGELTAMAMTGIDDRYVVTGDVTFRGVTRTYGERRRSRSSIATTLRLSGRASFDIRDFGMDPPRILMFKVEPEVDVRVDIVAEKEG